MKKTSFIRLFVTLFLLTSSLVQTTNLGSANPSSARSGTNAEPIAVDDSGLGYITDENTAFTTANVLANDSDPDGDPLFVETFDTISTSGQLSPVEGILDISFDNDGKLTTDFGSDEYGSAVVLQPDGKILVAGTSGDDFAVARYRPDGSLDTSFDGDGVVTTDIEGEDIGNAIALQSDNKIIVAGYTRQYPNNYDFAVARYNSDGSLDLTFDGDGKVITDFGGFDDYGNAIAIQPDGKIIVAGIAGEIDYGVDFALVRYNSDGSPDTTFDGDGKVSNVIPGSGFGLAVALQTDGKIIVAGFASGDFIVARFSIDGSLDTSFDNDGLAYTNFEGEDWALAISIQPNGKILVAGRSGAYDFALARYNPDGSMDTNFDNDGKVTTDFGSYDYGYAISLQPDGRIVVAGDTWLDDTFKIAVVRYNPDGSLDHNFSMNGKVITNIGSNNKGRSIALQPNGKIIVAGSSMISNWDFAMVRFGWDSTFTYNPNGQFSWLEPGEQTYDTFTYIVSDGILTDTATVSITIKGCYPPVAMDDNGPGFSTTEYVTFTTSSVLVNDTDPDSKGLFLESINTNGTVGLVSPLEAGSLDPSFDHDGRVVTDFGGFEGSGGIALQSDGKIVVAGGSDNNSALARYNMDGSLDTSFNDDGKVITDLGFDSGMGAVSLQPDGKIVTAGSANCSFALARYNPDGSLDNTFNGEGFVISRVGDCTQGGAVAIQTDSKIIVVGTTWFSGNMDFAVARFNPDGSLDTSFDGDGIVTTYFSGHAEARAIAIQPDNKIIVGGFAGIARYNPDGSLDTYFGVDGKANIGLEINAIVLQPDSKIVVAGHSNFDSTLARLNPDGNLDSSFGNDGIAVTSFGSADTYKGVALLPDGKIVASGGSDGDFILGRYNPDGSLDTSFDDDGKVITDFGSPYDWGFNLALQTDGKMIVAGYTETFYNNWDFAVARYSGGGTFTYDPNHQYDWLTVGQQAFDTFTYVVSDGFLTDTATVTITILGLDEIYLPIIITKE